MPAPSVHAVTPLVDAARRAHALRGGAAPRTPWLPPLPDLVHPVSEPSIPAHDPAPRATIGLVISMVRISISFAFQEMGPCASPEGAYGP